MVGERSSEISHALDHGLGIDVELLGQLAPVLKADIAQAVFAAELHGRLDAFDVYALVGKDTCHVIERREADAGLGTNEQRIILAVGVRAGNKPVVSDGIEEGAHIFWRICRIGFQQFDNVAYSRSTFALIFACRRNAERLAHVLLMDATQTGSGAGAVVALDDDGDLIPKTHDSGIHNGKTERASQFQTEMFVLGMSVEVAGRRLENVSGRDAA